MSHGLKLKALKVKTKGPEEKIQAAIVDFLTLRGWLVKRLIGNQYQSGWPDLYATHSTYKGRFIEVKDPDRKGDVFTHAQKEWFPKLAANGTPIWVLVGATEAEYAKLFKPQNWYQFLHVARVATRRA